MKLKGGKMNKFLIWQNVIAVSVLMVLAACSQLPMGSKGSQFQTCTILSSRGTALIPTYSSYQIRGVSSVRVNNNTLTLEHWPSQAGGFDTRTNLSKGSRNAELLICKAGSFEIRNDHVPGVCELYFERIDGLHSYPINDVVEIFQTRYFGTQGSWEIKSLSQGILRFGFVEDVYCEPV